MLFSEFMKKKDFCGGKGQRVEVLESTVENKSRFCVLVACLLNFNISMKY